MKVTQTLTILGITSVLAFTLAACNKPNSKNTAQTPTKTEATSSNINGLTGAGASFPAPLYAKWAADYASIGKPKINYQSVGSGAGMKQIEAKTVAFGASDEPLTDEVLKQKNLVQFPTVVGGVVPVVNINDVEPGAIVLDGKTLADIFLGKITVWNDPAIVALNPGVELKGNRITVVRRADGSGTSFNFTNYLSKVSPEWKTKVGQGKAVDWPVGIGGKGNEGVAAVVSRIKNSIGYVEYAYVKQNDMTFIKLKNAAGNIVEPNEDSFKAAAASANWSESFYQILTNQSGSGAWPITAGTFIMMQTKQDKPEVAAEVLKFFKWTYENGNKSSIELDYVALPDEVKELVMQSWVNIKDAATDKPIVFQ